MRRTERKKIETVKSGNQICGHITLNNLANPESIRITINGDKSNQLRMTYTDHQNFQKN
ncbi:MAG: hypothetical protein V8S10_05770 [Clostridia bacterium]